MKFSSNLNFVILLDYYSAAFYVFLGFFFNFIIFEGGPDIFEDWPDKIDYYLKFDNEFGLN
jgi:hypothetical protein